MSKFNIEKYLDHNGIEYKETDADYQLRECPSCGDRRWKFGISKESLLSHCFVCGEAYNVYGFVSLVEDVSIDRAKKIVHRDKDIRILSGAMKRKNIFQTKKGATKVQPIEMPEEFEKLKNPNKYLLRRNIDKNMIKSYDLRVCKDGKWRGRIIIPVYKDGILYGWQGRDYTGKAKQKIMSCKGFKKSRFVLNYDRIKNKKKIILSEGPFDCMHSDFFGAVAIFGKELSNDQINMLVKTRVQEVYIGLDPDFEENRTKAAKILSQFFDVYMMPIPDGKDLGDMSQEEIQESIDKSNLFNDFNTL